MDLLTGKKEDQNELNVRRNNSKEDVLSYSCVVSENDQLPRRLRGTLHSLFEQIETEFGTIYAENVKLRKTVVELTDKLNGIDSSLLSSEKSEANQSNGTESQKLLKGKYSGSSQFSQRLKTTYKSGTSKLVSSFKPTSNVVCRVAQEFHGHKDGIWDVASSNSNLDIAGSASADQKAKLWNVTTGACTGTYHGHSGSVNAIKFHPEKCIALTASGDSTVHMWTYEPNKSSSDENTTECSNTNQDSPDAEPKDYRTPLMRVKCHTSPVVCCDWVMGGLQFVTASWDRTACLVDSATSQIIQTLNGHDMPLTHVSAHSKHKIIVTSSRDATFRVCDFRASTVHTVIVGQGHSQPVSSAVFTDDDKVVSSGDDKYIKVWDLKSMRSPVASIRFDSPINRISVSRRGIIAIPHDNRQIRLYDTSGNRLARLPRNGRVSHDRVVTAASWVESSTPSLLTCGWDKLMINWTVGLPHSISQR